MRKRESKIFIFMAVFEPSLELKKAIEVCFSCFADVTVCHFSTQLLKLLSKGNEFQFLKKIVEHITFRCDMKIPVTASLS